LKEGEMPVKMTDYVALQAELLALRVQALRPRVNALEEQKKALKHQVQELRNKQTEWMQRGMNLVEKAHKIANRMPQTTPNPAAPKEDAAGADNLR
jgi:uncharacterized coiled-coil DUF342 family protein